MAPGRDRGRRDERGGLPPARLRGLPGRASGRRARAVAAARRRRVRGRVRDRAGLRGRSRPGRRDRGQAVPGRDGHPRRRERAAVWARRSSTRAIERALGTKVPFGEEEASRWSRAGSSRSPARSSSPRARHVEDVRPGQGRRRGPHGRDHRDARRPRVDPGLRGDRGPRPRRPGRGDRRAALRRARAGHARRGLRRRPAPARRARGAWPGAFLTRGITAPGPRPRRSAGISSPSRRRGRHGEPAATSSARCRRTRSSSTASWCRRSVSGEIVAIAGGSLHGRPSRSAR